MDFEGFSELLSGDMKIDLKKYLETHASENVQLNQLRMLSRLIYRIRWCVYLMVKHVLMELRTINLTDEELEAIKDRLYKAGVAYFEKPMNTHNLDAILSINNYNAGNAAAAKYPALTVPMGYTEDGQPKGLTFIARPYQESDLYTYAWLYEKETKLRQVPKQYDN